MTAATRKRVPVESSINATDARMLSTAVEVSCSLTQVTMFYEHAQVVTNTFDLNRVPSGSLEGSQESLLEEEIGGQSKMMEKWC